MRAVAATAVGADRLSVSGLLNMGCIAMIPCHLARTARQCASRLCRDFPVCSQSLGDFHYESRAPFIDICTYQRPQISVPTTQQRMRSALHGALMGNHSWSISLRTTMISLVLDIATQLLCSTATDARK
jgi:hypothetical protein